MAVNVLAMLSEWSSVGVGEAVGRSVSISCSTLNLWRIARAQTLKIPQAIHERQAMIDVC